VKLVSIKASFSLSIRLEMTRKVLEYEEKDKLERDPFRDEMNEERERPRKLFDSKSGKPLNVNQANIDFHYDDSHPQVLKVTLNIFKVTKSCINLTNNGIFKHLPTSDIDLDVQPAHLTARIKGKVFQLVFFEEVQCDKAQATRSTVSGDLIVEMPKLKPVFISKAIEEAKKPIVKKLEVEKPIALSKICDQDEDPPPLEEVED